MVPTLYWLIIYRLSTKVIDTILSIYVNKAFNLERPCFIEVGNLLSFTSTRTFRNYCLHRGKRRPLVKQGVISPNFICAPCAQLYSLADNPQPPPPRIWAHIRGRYWSTKVDDISLWPPWRRPIMTTWLIMITCLKQIWLIFFAQKLWFSQ